MGSLRTLRVACNCHCVCEIPLGHCRGGDIFGFLVGFYEHTTSFDITPFLGLKRVMLFLDNFHDLLSDE
jgi:hypothetical protein